MMSVHIRNFGMTADSKEVHLYTLESVSGMRVSVTDLGGMLQEVSVPDGKGGFIDVALGYDGASGYLRFGGSLGAIIGRNANRIAGASFDLGGTTHRLTNNDGENNIHSGPHVWRKRLWDVAEDPKDDPDGGASITFGLVSRDGDQGFPGTADVRATYTLHPDWRLELALEAQVTKTTIVNLTSHAYWNLNGHASGSVLRHSFSLDADAYTPVGKGLIPTGEIAPVEGTPYDLRESTNFENRLYALPDGLDTNFVLKNDERLEKVATLVGDETGVSMDLYTDAPGLQVYTGCGLKARGKGGAHYKAFDGVALEPQFFPDAIHHKNFPQPIYAPGHPFVSRMVFAFGLR